MMFPNDRLTSFNIARYLRLIFNRVSLTLGRRANNESLTDGLILPR